MSMTVRAARRYEPPTSIRVLRSVDGADIDVIMPGEAIAINPSYILAMRAIGCRRPGLMSFVFSAHWFGLVILGVFAGSLAHFRIPNSMVLLIMPLALVYYAGFTQFGCRVVRSMRRRQHLRDLLLIPEYDVFLLGVGIAQAWKYERARVASAAAAGVGVAMLTAAIAEPSGDLRLAALGAAFWLAAVIAAVHFGVRRKGRLYVTTFGEIDDALSWLNPAPGSLMRQTAGKWIGCAAVALITSAAVLLFPGSPLAPEIAAALCVAAVLHCHRIGRAPAPHTEAARQQIHEKISAAM